VTGPRAKRVSLKHDSGNAIIEFVFVAVLVLVPLVYLIVAVSVLQRARLATTDAARDVGRAIATADSREDAPARAAAALRIAVSSQGLSPSDVQLRYVAAGDDCQQGTQVVPSLNAGAQFQVCVIRHQRLAAVPTLLSGRGVVTIGRYLVHIDDFRTVAP
jgi:Flp pilus assembly protein TadG